MLQVLLISQRPSICLKSFEANACGLSLHLLIKVEFPPGRPARVNVFSGNCFFLRPAERPKREGVNATGDGSPSPREGEFGSWMEYISRKLADKTVSGGRVKGTYGFNPSG